MAKHIEIMNAVGNIVVDENYSVPMLIMKGRITASQYRSPPTVPEGYTIRQYFIDSYSWVGTHTFFTSGNLSDFGDIFKGLSAASNEEIILNRVRYFNRDLIILGRCVSGGYAIIPYGGLTWDQSTKKASFSVSTSCELQNGIVDVAIYKYKNIKPSSQFGLVIQNASGEVLYDVMKPPMMFLGSMSGSLNVGQYEAGRFEINIPDGINPSDCFVTALSGTPYYSAYQIYSGGVSWADTGFKSVITFPTRNTLRVQVVRVKEVPGSNSAFGYGGFFENVVYCPYPYGLYLDPSKS